MALKTQKTKASVAQFLNAIDDPDKRRDAKAVAKLMKDITGEKPAMWGTSIVGYGSYHYTYASGQSGDWPLTGFSGHKSLMKKLGKHKTGKSCLYIKTLEDVDLDVLRQLITKSVAHMKKKYPA